MDFFRQGLILTVQMNPYPPSGSCFTETIVLNVLTIQKKKIGIQVEVLFPMHTQAINQVSQVAFNILVTTSSDMIKLESGLDRQVCMINMPLVEIHNILNLAQIYEQNVGVSAFCECFLT